MNNISMSKGVNAFFILLFLLFFMAMPVFAQSAASAVSTMNDVAVKILEVMKGPLIKTILVIALCGCAIAFAVNKDNQRLRNGAIAIGVAVVILMAAPDIIDALWI